MRLFRIEPPAHLLPRLATDLTKQLLLFLLHLRLRTPLTLSTTHLPTSPRPSVPSAKTSNASSAAGSNWEDDLMSVTSSVASAFGTRHRPKTSIVEEFDAVPNLDAQVGVLHIEIQRYLQEAKDQLGLAGRDRLGM